MVNPENISSNILGEPNDLQGNVSLENNNLLVKTIGPNEGKVQVINLSASWCAPCKVALEDTKKLMDEYAGKNVVFSFICLTPDTKETRELYRSKGINDKSVYFSTNDDYYFLMKTFTPMVIPYGILVNKKGVIVDYGGHVRPSELLRERINLLLEQDNLIR